MLCNVKSWLRILGSRRSKNASQPDLSDGVDHRNPARLPFPSATSRPQTEARPEANGITAAMDPASAIGVASGILAFIDFGFKIVNGSIRIHSSSKGLDFDEFKDVAEKFESLARRLQPLILPHTEVEQQMVDIAASCRALALELAKIFHSVRPKDLDSKSQRVWAAVRLKMKEGQTQEHEQRLNRYRDQFQMILLTSNYFTG